MFTGLLLLAGVALITLALLMMLRKRKHRTANEPTAREQLERLKQKQAMRGDLEHLMVELEQLTRRFNAQLDAKSLQLEKLVHQADRRIDELKRLQGEGPTQEPPEAPHKPPATGDGSDRAGLAAPHDANAEPRRPDNALGVEEDELTRRVYALADQGHGPPEIASELDEHVGKIELMLALRKA